MPKRRARCSARENVDLAELREICDDIVTEDNRAAEVIRRLGALYKRGEMKIAPLDLNELMRETLDLLRAELLIRHVTPVTELAPSLPVVDGGRVQLQQVLSQSRPECRGRDERNRGRVSGKPGDPHRTRRRGGAAVRHRQRAGHRAADHRSNVFDAFWSTKPGGMGIGLAICQSIVAAHRGRLTAANNPDGGATFCVSLPRGQPA